MAGSATVRAGLALACCLTASTAAPGLRGADRVSEYEVKGAFLFHFIRLIDWPTTAGAGTGAFQLCVIGESTIGAALEPLAAAPIKGRRVVVRQVDKTADVAACQVVFISERANGSLDGVIRTLRPGVLTVSETDADEPAGTVINFVVDNDRVEFDISVAAATRAQLSVSPRLLSVARAIDGRKRRKD